LGALNVIGKCKWFEPTRKYGFLSSPDSESEIFFHISGIAEGHKIADGDTVEFEIAPDKKTGKTKAVNVRRLAEAV
jgi:cold shock protein